MPTYEFSCGQCGHDFDVVRTIAARNDPAKCPGCQSDKTERVMSPVGLAFIGDGWATKNGRVAKQMQAKNSRLNQKMTERKNDGSGHMRLVPNVGGEQVDTWSEAKQLAASKGKSTAGYDKKIAEEKSTKKTVSP